MSAKAWREERLQSTTVVKATRRWMAQYAGTLGILAVFVGIWSAYARFNGRPNYYFPSPTFTYQQTVEHGDEVLLAFQTTLTSVILGFILAVFIGIALGSIMAEIVTIQRTVMPLYIFVYSLPHAIMAPLFILWFGTGHVGLGLFVAWGAFFPIFINTMTGLNQLDSDFYQLASIFDATDWQIFKYMKFWAALPHIASGMKIGAQISIVSAIIAEFIASGSGLGYLIVISNQRAQVGLMFGTILLIMVFGVVYFASISKLIDYASPGA